MLVEQWGCTICSVLPRVGSVSRLPKSSSASDSDTSFLAECCDIMRVSKPQARKPPNPKSVKETLKTKTLNPKPTKPQTLNPVSGLCHPLFATQLPSYFRPETGPGKLRRALPVGEAHSKLSIENLGRLYNALAAAKVKMGHFGLIAARAAGWQSARAEACDSAEGAVLGLRCGTGGSSSGGC